MQPAPPKLYENVMLFGSTSDPPKVGGWLLQPHLALSYLLAARYVIEGGERSGRLSEVALPAAYLQRHALELELKDIIDGARGIAADKLWLGRPVTEPYPTPAPAPPTHYLDDKEVTKGGIQVKEPGLLSLAREAVKEAEFECSELPDVIGELVADLNELDKGAPDRFRYSRIKAPKGKPNPSGRGWLRSFEEPTALDVVGTQERFEALYQEHLALRDFDDNWNFGSWLSREAEHWGEKVARREYENPHAPAGSAEGGGTK